LLATELPAMDLVLETFDAVLFDSLYAIVLPVQRLDLASNGTYSSLREAPTAAPYVAQNTWHYKAASQYWSLPPSEYAYMSEWTRDDWRRQLVTLFLITWYVFTIPSFCFRRI
jgi:lathosterol oxidase